MVGVHILDVLHALLTLCVRLHSGLLVLHHTLTAVSDALLLVLSACCWLRSTLPAVGYALHSLLLAMLFSPCSWLCSSVPSVGYALAVGYSLQLGMFFTPCSWVCSSTRLHLRCRSCRVSSRYVRSRASPSRDRRSLHLVCCEALFLQRTSLLCRAVRSPTCCPTCLLRPHAAPRAARGTLTASPAPPSSARCAWVRSPALSGRGSPAPASLPLRPFTRRACNSVDREFDSCGNRLGMDEARRYSARGPLSCECQRESAIVHRGPVVRLLRTLACLAALASASGLQSRQSSWSNDTPVRPRPSASLWPGASWLVGTSRLVSALRSCAD